MVRPILTAFILIKYKHERDIQHERDILELPVRCGGLGIINPVRIASREYAFSVALTKDLVSLINQQDQDVTKLDSGYGQDERKERRTEKTER